jgi:NADH dehydrogenase [ubiquinone] 1 alpha subcomplex assembly factor 7
VSNCVKQKLSISSASEMINLSRFLVQNSRPVASTYLKRIGSCSSYQIRSFTSTNLAFSKESILDELYPTVDDFHLPKTAAKRVNNEVSFSVDRTGMVNYAIVEANLEADEKNDPRNAPGKEVLTPLAEDIYSLIEIKGPISIHEYMSQTLNHSVHGYYQTGEVATATEEEGKQKEIHEKIGERGDFITSPEISQLFGEMIGIWIFSSWQALGSPAAFDVIELGPGKGTLMKDILKVLKKLSSSCLSAVNIHFVELSSHLRQRQFDAIQEGSGKLTAVTSSKEKERGEKKEATNSAETKQDEQESQPSKKRIRDQDVFHLSMADSSVSIPVSWHSFINQIPSKNPCLVIGQEFLDAFPVHQFIYTEKGWREKLVDIDRAVYSSPPIIGEPKETDQKAKKQQETEKTSLPPQEVTLSTSSIPVQYPYHFRLVLSPAETPAIKSLIKSENPQVKALLGTIASSTKFAGDSPKAKIGDGLEICPLGLAVVEDIAQRVVTTKGAALFIDYGEDFLQEDTIRGFKKHKVTHILSEVC